MSYKPAVAYLRRSTDRQEQSIPDQRRIIESYALKHEYEILSFYTDDAVSGASSERDSFQSLIKDAKKSGCAFQFVLVYDIKRFGRVDNDEAGYYRHQLRLNGIEVIYVSEGFNGDDTDDLLRPVKQWQARQELKDLSKVTIRGLLTRVEGGWWNGGVPPWGYDLAYFSGNGDFVCVVRFMEDGSKEVLDGEGKILRRVERGDAVQFTKQDKSRLVLSCPERVNTIKQILDWYVKDGVGYKGICDRLNRKGIPAPRSGRKSEVVKKWCSTTIIGIIQNPAYTGDMVWNRVSFAKFFRISDKKAVATKQFPGHGPLRNGEEDWIVQENTHPAIISKTAFREAEKRRENTARFGAANVGNCGRGAHSPFLLSGLIRCKNCGHKWLGYTVNGKKKLDGTKSKTLYYACGGYVMKGKSVCPRHVVGKEWLEGWVIGRIEEMLREYFGTEEGIEKIKAMIAEEIKISSEEIEKESTFLDEETLKIKRTINNLIENISSTNKEFVDQRLIELKRELSALESKKREIEDAKNKQNEVSRMIEQAKELADDFKETFAAGTVEQKKLFLRAFLKEITLDPVKGTGEGVFVLMPGAEKKQIIYRLLTLFSKNLTKSLHFCIFY